MVLMGNVLNWFQYINCHMAFDIKMKDFWRKACLMMGGHMTHTLDTIPYSTVVNRETVCIDFTMTVLCDLEVKAGDLFNAYIIAPNHEKTLTVLGPKFGDDAGKSAIIVRVL